MSVPDLKVMVKHIDLAVAMNCNLVCKTCGNREPIAGQAEMSKDDVLRLLRDAAGLGLESIAFSGGEALLRPDIFELLTYARNVGIREVILVSNGVLITEAVARKLAESGCTNANLSLEGTEPYNDFIRGKGTFKRVVAAIEHLQKQAPQIMISVNTVISKHNYPNLMDFTRLLVEELNIKRLTYSPLNPAMMGTHNLEHYREQMILAPEEIPLVAQMLEQLIAYSHQRDEVSFPPAAYLRKFPDFFAGQKMIPTQPCLVPTRYCGIDGAGNVFPCWVEYCNVGNIRQESFRDIVVKDIYRKQCEAAFAKHCRGCLVSCYPEVHEIELQGA